MRQVRPYPQVTVTRKAARLLASGHPWVYAGEVLSVAEAPATGAAVVNGDMVDVVEANGTWQGAGLYSEQSTIRVRLVSRNANDRFDEGFWRRRIAWAWRYRMSVMGGRGVGGERDLACCRVVFGEADGLPGLVVDRYGSVLVAQVGTVGMERLRRQLYPLLLDVLREAGEDVRAIYERCDGANRTKEGLGSRRGWWDGAGPAVSVEAGGIVSIGGDSTAGGTAAGDDGLADGASGGTIGGDDTAGDAASDDGAADGGAAGGAADTSVIIHEGGVAYELDLAESQKTGFFLDQKYNRRAVARLASGRRVLDCFCHVGPFGLSALRGGAAYVRCVDVSQTALDLARRNARLNGFAADVGEGPEAGSGSISAGSIGFTCANVLEYLPELHRSRSLLHAEGGPFDLIVLDPPAFTKSRNTVRNAARGYREINAWAMRLLPRGGYLATCSCSHFMTTELLSQALAEAAHSVNVQLRQVEQRQQAPDHPILWGFPQSHYLDFFIFQVV